MAECRNWFGVTPALYRTRAGARSAEVFHRDGVGWFASLFGGGKPTRIRGPVSCLDVAMDAVEELLRKEMAQ